MLKSILRFLRLRRIVVATGGGFDPVHEGHVRLFKEAKKLGDVLVVMLNSDEQLRKKKGEPFYPSEDERREIIESIRYVDKVIIDPGKDVTCEEALKLVKPDILAKGGDRVEGAMPEIELKVCKELGCRIVYNVGGAKVQSSSWLLKRLKGTDVGLPTMKLIIINGAPGIGKTTVSKLLHNQLSNSAFLDGDDVWRINPFEVNEKTKSLVEKNITLVLRNYIEAGYEYVIFAWVLHQQSTINRLISYLHEFAPEIHIFTLVTDESTLTTRLQADTELTRNPDIARDRLKQSRPLESKKINTTGVKPEKIVREILSQ